jgi:hypothetical protein
MPSCAYGIAVVGLGKQKMISTHPHERFSAVLSLDPGSISAFARAVGDMNPLHHNADFAAATRFGWLTASGPQRQHTSWHLPRPLLQAMCSASHLRSVLASNLCRRNDFDRMARHIREKASSSQWRDHRFARSHLKTKR